MDTFPCCGVREHATIFMIDHNNDNQAKMDILLSSCGTNEFSCSDGACVDLHMRCDLFPDCLDKVCTVITIDYK